MEKHAKWICHKLFFDFVTYIKNIYSKFYEKLLESFQGIEKHTQYVPENTPDGTQQMATPINFF